MDELTRRISDNVDDVRRRIADAAARSGRSAGQVKLVAVSKYVGEPEIRALAAAGCDVLGENRPQALWNKAEALGDLQVRWHMIGPLQRNKIRRTLPLVEMVQSVHSQRSITAIDRIAGELSRRVPVLLEVNVSGEAAKDGFEPEAVAGLLPEMAACRHVWVRGLMCMAGWGGPPEAARGNFASLRELRDRLREDCPEGIELDELSMGMSGDFEAAIEEGATIVRIGSVLFEGVR